MMTRSLKEKFLKLSFIAGFVFFFATTVEAKHSQEHKERNLASEELTESELLVKNISIQVQGVVDYGCIGRHSYSNENLESHRMFTNALKKKRSVSKNILCMMKNQNKKVTLG